ncbi:hypothetical protein U9M48_042676 [Paspalum notatum var. saurae]|uniref:Small RNA 2'-O-methyltransferase n=1 Tax=Paspalum notatum var. saurae TaxID=547442 RepID=A0AAQ3UXL2_PASNO
MTPPTRTRRPVSRAGRRDHTPMPPKPPAPHAARSRRAHAAGSRRRATTARKPASHATPDAPSRAPDVATRRRRGTPPPRRGQLVLAGQTPVPRLPASGSPTVGEGLERRRKRRPALPRLRPSARAPRAKPFGPFRSSTPATLGLLPRRGSLHRLQDILEDPATLTDVDAVDIGDAELCLPTPRPRALAGSVPSRSPRACSPPRLRGRVESLPWEEVIRRWDHASKDQWLDAWTPLLIADFGYGSGSLLDSLLGHPTTLEKLVGVDISRKGLTIVAKSLHQKLSKKSLTQTTVPNAVLYDGSITNYDSRLYDFDIDTCLEVIEHVEEG